MSNNKDWINVNTVRIEALTQRLENMSLGNPSGVIDIETNGIHNVTDYAEANVNVPSKEPVLQEKTVNENGEYVPDTGYDGFSKFYVNVESSGSGAKTSYEKIVEGFKEIQNNLKPTHNKIYDTHEQVTLYTPAEGFTNYFIHKKQNGTFRILWGGANIVCFQQTKNELVGCSRLHVIGYFIEDGNTTGSLAFNASSPTVQVTVYYSGEYSTPEECISAIQNNSTTYTKTSYFSMNASLYENTQTSVVLTNYIEVGKTFLVNECGRQISSNENIAVI